MEMITNQRIIEVKELTRLEQVNDLLKEGWLLYTASNHEGNFYYLLVRKGDQ